MQHLKEKSWTMLNEDISTEPLLKQVMLTEVQE